MTMARSGGEWGPRGKKIRAHPGSQSAAVHSPEPGLDMTDHSARFNKDCTLGDEVGVAVAKLYTITHRSG
jgi:hypothetical protein